MDGLNKVFQPDVIDASGSVRDLGAADFSAASPVGPQPHRGGLDPSPAPLPKQPNRGGLDNSPVSPPAQPNRGGLWNGFTKWLLGGR